MKFYSAKEVSFLAVFLIHLVKNWSLKEEFASRGSLNYSPEKICCHTKNSCSSDIEIMKVDTVMHKGEYLKVSKKSIIQKFIPSVCSPALPLARFAC